MDQWKRKVKRTGAAKTASEVVDGRGPRGARAAEVSRARGERRSRFHLNGT
jgi:hypothetical protein